MDKWTPVLALPNLDMRGTLECPYAAIVGPTDSRVEKLRATHPKIFRPIPVERHVGIIVACKFTCGALDFRGRARSARPPPRSRAGAASSSRRSADRANTK
jgi:hypothetical protein